MRVVIFFFFGWSQSSCMPLFPGFVRSEANWLLVMGLRNILSWYQEAIKVRQRLLMTFTLTSKCLLSVSSSCVSVKADFLHWSDPSAYRCLLFRLLFSLGIPVWDMPPTCLREDREGASGSWQLYYHFIRLQVVWEKSDSWTATRCGVKALRVVVTCRA